MRIKPALMTDDATTVMRLLEFTDSAFPVGTFSFSNGLETAAEEGLVHDAATLEQYTQDIVRRPPSPTESRRCTLSAAITSVITRVSSMPTVRPFSAR